MIRMGRKYNISFMKKSALTFLRNLFPQELGQWDVSQSEVKKLCSPGKPFLFEAINLAYANDILSILPAAFLSMYTIYGLVRRQNMPLYFFRKLIYFGTAHNLVRNQNQRPTYNAKFYGLETVFGRSVDFLIIFFQIHGRRYREWRAGRKQQECL